MNIRFETEKYLIRDLEETDVDGMFLLDSDPAVHRFLGNNPISSKEQSIDIIRKVQQQYIDYGIGRWAIIDKGTNDFVGWTGLKYEQVLRKEINYYDLGYRLRKKYWGQGIASITALESLRYGFEKLNLPEINAAADIDHVVSNHILQKVGLQCLDTFTYENILHNWYGLKREDWNKRVL